MPRRCGDGGRALTNSKPQMLYFKLHAVLRRCQRSAYAARTTHDTKTLGSLVRPLGQSALCPRKLPLVRARPLTRMFQRWLGLLDALSGRLAWFARRRQSVWMRVALFEPEIAGNVGAVLRLGACLGIDVDLIEPMGFAWDDRRVRRTAMDYIDHVAIARHAGFDAFKTTIGSRRLVLFTTKSDQSSFDFAFRADDILLFGKESAGVPTTTADICDARVRIPMRPQVRSMNLATSVALALGEALRQTGSLPAGAI